MVLPMNKVSEICETVGRDAIMQRLGVKKSAVSNAVIAGQFPASWYAEVRALCEGAQIDCPIDAFGFKSEKQSGAAQ